MRERVKEGKVGSEWERERKEYFKRKGWKIEEVEERREEEDG